MKNNRKNGNRTEKTENKVIVCSSDDTIEKQNFGYAEQRFPFFPFFPWDIK